jgi:hypothetical protein
MRPGSLPAGAYALALVSRGLHEQAQAVLAISPASRPGATADQLLAHAQIAVRNGEKRQARQYCLAYLQQWRDPGLAALAAALNDAGMDDAGQMLSALCAAGGLEAIIEGASHE